MTFDLTARDKETAIWLEIEKQVRQRIEVLQRDLENAKTWDDSQIIRGRLRELRGILIADVDKPKQEPDLQQLY